MEISSYYLEKLLNFFKSQAWLLYALLVVMIAIVLTYGIHLMNQRLIKKWQNKGYLVVQVLTQAVYWPLIIFIWLEAISINSNVFIPNIEEGVINLIEKIRKVGLLILLAWVIIRFIKLFEEQLLKGNFKSEGTDKTTIQAMGKLLRVAAFTIITLLLLPVMGIEITGILAVASGSVVIVGIAAQQIIANYFGGFVVHSDGHFKVGDWIYSPDRNLEGIVEYIGWRSTHIRTFDRRMLYVPNAIFSSAILVNASRMTNRRIKDTINIRYEDVQKLNIILEDLNKLLHQHPDLDKTRRLAVHFTEFGPFSIKLTIYAFTYTIDWQMYRDIQQKLFLEIIKVINDHGAQIIAAPAVAIEPKEQKG